MRGGIEIVIGKAVARIGLRTACVRIAMIKSVLYFMLLQHRFTIPIKKYSTSQTTKQKSQGRNVFVVVGGVGSEMAVKELR